MSGAGRVCAVHGEWCPDGECRWCAPAAPLLDAGGYLVPREVEKRREFGAGPVERVLPKLLDAPRAAPVPPIEAPLVDCFCGEWHFEPSALLPSGRPPSPPRDPDGALHTPDACGRFAPSPSRYVALRFTVGDGSTKAEVVPVADPEHALRPWDPAEALRLLRGCLAPAPDITPLVPCSCGAYSFVPASYAPGTPLRSRESNGDFHAPEACLDRAGHELPPGARAALVPCCCGARKVPAGQELSLLDVAIANDRHSADYCIDAAGRTYGHTAPDLEHP